MLLLLVSIVTIPRISISPLGHNFGEIGWETTSYTFTIRNIGDDTLSIQKVTTSCGCTQASVRKRVIKPGDTTSLTVRFLPGLHRISGKVKRKIMIYSNDPVMPVKSIYIRANVIPPTKFKKSRVEYHEIPEYAFRSANILRAYEFVVQNSDYVASFPCYCGCDIASEHKNLKDCFISKEAYDDHASNCTVCVREALDVLNMKKENRDIDEITKHLEKNYKSFHPED